MNTVAVTNLTKLTQHVGVVHADGTPDYVQVVPRKRVNLRVGMIVDPNWLGLNTGVLKIEVPQQTVKVGMLRSPPPVQAPVTEVSKKTDKEGDV